MNRELYYTIVKNLKNHLQYENVKNILKTRQCFHLSFFHGKTGKVTSSTSLQNADSFYLSHKIRSSEMVALHAKSYKPYKENSTEHGHTWVSIVVQSLVVSAGNGIARALFPLSCELYSNLWDSVIHTLWNQVPEKLRKVKPVLHGLFDTLWSQIRTAKKHEKIYSMYQELW